MNATEMQLLVSSEVQRYNLKKKERPKAANYNPRAFTLSAYHIETAYRTPIDTYFGDVEVEVPITDKIPTQVFGADLIYRREDICVAAIGGQVHVYERGAQAKAVYKSHSGSITDVQHIPKTSEEQSMGLRFATCDTNSKICIWAYFPRSENAPKKEKDGQGRFKTFFSMQLAKDLGHAVKTFFVSADAGKTLRMFVLLASGQLNCYDLDSDLESNRKAEAVEVANRTIVTPCERAPRRVFVSENYVVLSTRERVSGFCPYALQPLFDFDCKYRPREVPNAPAEPLPPQNINFIHVIDQTTVAIATDTTLQLWNVMQQRPVLIQTIKTDLSGYKLQGVTPAANSEHIRMQAKVLERLQSDFAEMVESEAQALTRDLCAFRDQKWCFVAYPTVGGTANNVGESNLPIHGLAATPTHLPLLLFHLGYGHKGWVVDYILPFAVTSAAVSFHIAPKWEPSPEGFSEYALTAMHPQYIERMVFANTRQSAVSDFTGKPHVSIQSPEKPVEAVDIDDFQDIQEIEASPCSTRVPQASEDEDCILGLQTDAHAGQIMSDEAIAELLENATLQCQQIEGMGAFMEQQAITLENITKTLEANARESLESTTTYVQRKLDQLRAHIKKNTEKQQERFREAMDAFAQRCLEELTGAFEESFRALSGESGQRNRLAKEARRVSASLVERCMGQHKDTTLRAVAIEHERLRDELTDWCERLNIKIDGVRQGVSDALANKQSVPQIKEKFSYAKAEELIAGDAAGRALELASETGDLQAVSFCFDKIAQSGRDKCMIFAPGATTKETAVRILGILTDDLSDAETIDMRLEWIQVLCMSELFMERSPQLVESKKAALEKLKAARANSALRPQQVYRVKLMMNVLRAV